jgi:hypothetical protein
MEDKRKAKSPVSPAFQTLIESQSPGVLAGLCILYTMPNDSGGR